jgi:glycosyltransferase involved in cell wall biosynthesis
MKLSVIIPSYQGSKKLPVVLSALQKQTFKAFELIVVIDGSTDDSVALLKNNYSYIDQVIVQDNKGRSGAKNAGAAHATGDVLIFFDDDMEPGPRSVERHVLFHQDYPNAVLAGNPVEFETENKSEIQNYKAWISEQWLSRFTPGVQQMSLNNLFFTAANCSIKKEIFQMLRGFNEDLTDAEDFELAVRAIKSGVPAFFDKDNIAIHHDPITWKKYVIRVAQYRKANLKLRVMHPEIRSYDSEHESSVKNFIYSILAYRKIPGWLERFSVFKKLPKSIRYRFYSAVIHAQTMQKEVEPKRP